MSAAPQTPKAAARRFASDWLAKGFEPASLHIYTDRAGAPLYWRMRLKHPGSGEKVVRPFYRNGAGYVLGEPDFAGRRKPIYRLHEIVTAPPEHPVWWTEGEQKAEALERLGLVATTAGGAQADARADLEPLRGRRVIIWPDHDEPGCEHALRVAALLREIGCTAEIVDVEPLGLPKGGDVIDYLAARPQTTAAELEALARLPANAAATEDRDLGPQGASRARQPLDAELVTRCVADVLAERVRWLWPGRIARGKVAVIAGHPGLGKSQISLSLAAVVTTGGRWPVDRTTCERGQVLIVSAEDDVSDTIRPRLEAAGADLSRCHVLDAVKAQEPDGTVTRRGFSLTADLPRLATKLAELGDVALVIIDPVTAYLGETDSHKAAEVRAVLAPLGEVAACHGAAVVCVSHLRKGGGGDAILQVTGSLAFVAAARAAYIVTKDPQDPARRLLLPAKNNLGDDQTGYAFRVESVALAGDILTSRVSWEAERVTTTADEALAPAQAAEERSATDEAADWLRDLLAAGPMKASDVQREARRAGIGDKPLRAARERLGIKPRKSAFTGGWEWELRRAAQDAQGAQGARSCHVAKDGHLRGQRASSGVAGTSPPAPADDDGEVLL